MGIIEEAMISWQPGLQALAQGIGAQASDMPSLEKAYAEALRSFSPCVHARSIQIEAIGDHFVLLSGVWVEEERVVRALSNADHLLAFAVTGMEADVGDWQAIAEMAANDCVLEWLDGMSRRTEERFDAVYFRPSPEWMDLFSLPLKVYQCGIAYTSVRHVCSCSLKGCEGCSCKVQQR